MNYELILLQNTVFIGKTAPTLRNSAKLLAMSSYDTTGYRDGTVGQIAAIEDLLSLADKYERLFLTVKRALFLVPAPQRALLVAVYFRRKNKRDIADRYGASLSTVYRKLLSARKCFVERLCRLGLTQELFEREFGELNISLLKKDGTVKYPVQTHWTSS